MMGKLFLPLSSSCLSWTDHNIETHRIILETDAAAIASRVSRPRPDTTDIVINEQTLMNAYTSLRDRVSQKIQQF